MNTRTPNKPFKARKKEILRLHKKGLSYRTIAKKLGCSKGTISYHCGKNQTEKKRVRKANKARGYDLSKKVTAFIRLRFDTWIHPVQIPRIAIYAKPQ